jgi:hypothetical protein
MSRESPYEDSARGGIADVGASFAGVLLVLTSFMEILHGISAAADPELYAAGSDFVYRFNGTVWGITHIVIGVVSMVVAFGILRRRSWGQLGGMIVCGLGILANFADLPRYPAWSIVVIAFYAFVIWALNVQYRGMQS